MADTAGRPGGRRGVVAAAAAVAVGVIGATLIAAGATGGSGGPPQPPPSAAGSPRSPSSLSPPPADRVDGQRDSGEGEGSPRTLGRSKPVALDIPAIGVSTEDLIPLGKRPDGRIQVPDLRAAGAVGWYEGGPSPGQFGPAVLGGHVDTRSGPAIFFRLGDIRPGDRVAVRRADGGTAVFTVYSVKRFPKSEFPTRTVYAPTSDRAELRLVTCGGVFDADTGHHRDNIVAYATMTDVR